MVDLLNRSRRSWNMSRIRSCDTRPEKAVRSLLHALGFRFRLHRRDLPGRPDIVLPRYQSVIFVHGCFWHQHAGCIDCSRPASNSDYWLSKLARNVERDREHIAKLTARGWNVIVVWECETAKPAVLADRLLREIRFKN
jgi:DNA mismatch endonuclease (patch repair protein)